jgi:hypothetical protein
MRFRPKTVLALSVLASLTASVGVGVMLMQPDTPAETAECKPPARAQVRHELVFGTARAQGVPLGEDEWQSFVDTVVTPRFPDGLTVWDARGQWQGPGGTVMREGTFVLELVHVLDREGESRVEAVIAEYKRRFAQQSVLRVVTAARASF